MDMGGFSLCSRVCFLSASAVAVKAIAAVKANRQMSDFPYWKALRLRARKRNIALIMKVFTIWE